MRTLYIDCGMGAAGDMLTAALLELFENPSEIIEELNELGIPGVKYVSHASEKCGIKGTHISVEINGVEESEDMHHEHEHDHHHEHHHEHDHHHEHHHEHDDYHEHHHEHDHAHEHHHHEHDHNHDDHHAGHSHSHNNMAGIKHIVCDHMSLPNELSEKIIGIYEIIAEAESKAHGVPVSEIHFHEVGSMDAIADITAVCYLINRLSPDRIVASPVHVGSGQVKCAHGILPVPAPATAYILRDIPMYGGEINGELCTPTGAALLRYFVDEFGNMPVIRTEAIGYGMGKKDFSRANCVRVLIGEESASSLEKVTELSCNIDDMTPEEIGFAMERLLEMGALDVYTIAIGMKKNRPGVMLCALCRDCKLEELRAAFFKYTTTIGVRECDFLRSTLDRQIVTENTQYGEVRKKISTGYGIKREKYEYEDIARIARENNISVGEVVKNML